jgi:hypothetical protein
MVYIPATAYRLLMHLSLESGRAYRERARREVTQFDCKGTNQGRFDLQSLC